MNLINEYNDYVKLKRKKEKRTNELWKNLFLFSSPLKKNLTNLQYIAIVYSGKK